MRIERFAVWACRDCGWTGNRPEVEENYQEGWEKPWTRYGCPECAEVLREVETVAISDLAKWLRERIADAYKENSPESAPKIVVCMALRDLLEGSD